MKILVLNSGSSTLKYKLFLIDEKQELLLGGGVADKIGHEDSFIQYSKNGEDVHYEVFLEHHQKAIELLITHVLVDEEKQNLIHDMHEIEAVGHRIVHGGERFKESHLIDADVIKAIEEFSRFAPLHNPPNLNGIYSCTRALPDVPQVAVFDTAFHQTIPDYAYLYALPLAYYENEGYRRYGFHGTSHRYVANEAVVRLGKQGTSRMITCHLGNGASIAAIKDGVSVETSMGFTPLEGLIMGTRCGDIDPALVLDLTDHHSVKNIDKLLNKESGLLGITGISNDMRTIIDEVENNGPHKKRCQLALNMYMHRIKKYIGAYTAVLGGLDVLVFTAGIGEHVPYIREKIILGMEDFGLVLDQQANNKNEYIISKKKAKAHIMVIPTNEELVIARDTYLLARKT